MRKITFVICFFLASICCFSQSVAEKLRTAYEKFAADSQLRHAIASLYVIDAATGEVIFDRNASVGLAPASTQKIITSVTAFELLGADYRYKTQFWNRKSGKESELVVLGSGDPTFGSWRYANTKDSAIFEELYHALKRRHVKEITKVIVPETANTPFSDGWIWQDIGNYYGAGHYQLNWRENQYDLTFSSDVQNSATKIVSLNPPVPNAVMNNQVKAGAPGSGDNAYIYFTPGKDVLLVKGTIPPGQKSFSISGAMPEPAYVFVSTMTRFYSGVKRFIATSDKFEVRRQIGFSVNNPPPSELDSVYTHFSPPLDSIIYWFNKRSINSYGEALIRTFSGSGMNGALGRVEDGIDTLKRFWKERGIDPGELNMADGSGLSPLNRVTTHAQVEILKYAKTRSWYPSFYDALPEFNNMKMKSGTISDVKGFCGYHKSKEGKEYIFSFLVNNYDGRASQVVGKMYRVLDVLK